MALAAIAAMALTLARYEQARDAWRAHAAFDAADYDAAASDAAYLEVESAFVWVERTARGAALVIVAAGIAVGRGRAKYGRRERASLGRRIAARAIDAAIVVLAFALSRITTASPAMTECAEWTLPALVIAVAIGALVNGATIGERIARPR